MPEEPESWAGVRNCCCRFAGFGGESPPCMQRNVVLPLRDFLIFGSEDCLYLNVFTPRLPGGGRAAAGGDRQEPLDNRNVDGTPSNETGGWSFNSISKIVTFFHIVL